MSDLALGIDVGTSGVRIAAIDRDARIVAFAEAAMPAARRDGHRITQDSSVWVRALDEAMARLAALVNLERVGALAVDGTSGSLVAVDAAGRPVAAASLYNDRADDAAVERVGDAAPATSAARGATSPLARAVRLLQVAGVARVVHQADFIAGQLSGRFDVSDENNALKTGYDPVARNWPTWIAAAGVAPDMLPAVIPAGTVVGGVTVDAAKRFGLPASAIVVAGTTDGCAAFLATGAGKPGEAVTSLGSTLVVKLACDRPVFAPEHGLYSHRIGDLWLAGGASNTGGAALARFFSTEAIREISSRIDPGQPTGLDYYPLPASGERFPINDPALEPRVTPRPVDDAKFLHGLLEGIARIEALGYQRLAELGAPPLSCVYTVGGGAANQAWSGIRGSILGVPLKRAEHDAAAVGAARLARRAIERQASP
jgi:sugar (pentulose or hexulose) kinase